MSILSRGLVLSTLIFLTSCATDSDRIRFLKREYPDCAISDDGDLACPNEFDGFDKDDLGNNISVPPKVLPKKKILPKKAKKKKKKKPELDVSQA